MLTIKTREKIIARRVTVFEDIFKPAFFPAMYAFQDCMRQVKEWSERRRSLLTAFTLITLSALYFAATIRLSAAKFFWYDEFFTLYISKLPELRDFWSAMHEGLDSNPPLFFAISRGSLNVFGDTHLGLRMPSICGFWVMSICLFLLTTRRCGRMAGLAAMLFPWITVAYGYAYEGRPYGLVLGFFSMSLLCWHFATEGQYRPVALTGLTLSLAGALLCHCYAVLLIAPLAAGEITRGITRRRADWPVWWSLGLSCLATLFYLPILEASKAMLSNTWSRPYWNQTISFHSFLFSPAYVPLAAILLLAGTAAALDKLCPASNRSSFRSGFALHEIAAAIVLIAMPILGIATGKLVTGIFTERYALWAVIGWALLCGSMVHGWRVAHRTMAAGLIGIFLLWFGDLQLFKLRSDKNIWTADNPVTILTRMLERAGYDTGPVVVTNDHMFIELSYYAKPNLASRLVYLRDSTAALQYTNTDIFERGLPLISRWFPMQLRTENMEDYLKTHKRFLAFGHPDGDWQPSKLKDDGASLEWKDQRGREVLFSVNAR